MNALRVIVVAAVFVLIPGLHGDEMADEQTCLNQLRELASLNLLFTREHDGLLPKSFDELLSIQKKPDRSLLIAPLAADRTRPSYELRLPGRQISSVTDPARTIAIHSLYEFRDGRRFAAFADGHVEIVPSLTVRELAGPEQLFQVLLEAKTILFSGKLPEISNANRREVRCIINRPEQIKTLSTFFRTSNFQPDAEGTTLFKEGGKLSAAFHSRVVIDNKWSFEIVGSNKAIFADSLTYHFRRLDGRDDIPRALSEILKDMQNSPP